MPVNLTVRPLTGRRPAVEPLDAGGYGRVSTPNPNAASATYRRRNGSPVAGATTGGDVFKTTGFDPHLVAGGRSALSENIGREQRAAEHAKAFDDAEQQKNMFGVTSLRSVPRDPAWNMLFQALAEAGATRVGTAAGTRSGPPGFFDTPIMGAEQARRLRLLDAMAANGGGY